MPNVAFLGICERASYTNQGPFVLQNLIGLRQQVVSFIYPISIGGWKFVWALYDPENIKCPTDVHFVGPDDVTVFTLTLRIESQTRQEANTSPPPNSAGPFPARPQEPFWLMVTAGVSPPSLLFRPGLYRAKLDTGEQIGVLECYAANPPPLTPDRVSAIRANPRASRSIELAYECNSCDARIRTYAALERNSEREAEGAVWFSELQDFFVCKCGKSNIDLTLVKRNLHGLLGLPMGEISNQAIVPMYERATIDTIFAQFYDLIGSDCAEEDIQRFITEHPVLLAPFSPERVLFKSPILSKFKTDITILTRTGKLLLIEIEKSSKRLLTKAGESTAHLQHALTQVRDWLAEFREHRLACLSCLGLAPSDIHSIGAVVIMGRDTDHDQKRLRWLKGVDHGRDVEVMTYDDLLHKTDAVINSIGKV